MDIQYFHAFLQLKERNLCMNEQLNNLDSQGSPSSGDIDQPLPAYLLEAALDREWERRHRQGQFGKAQGTPAEKEQSS